MIRKEGTTKAAPIEQRRRQFLSLIGGAGTIGLAGCIAGDEGESDGGETDDSQFNFALATEIDTLDIHATGRVPEQIVGNAIHDQLFRLNYDLEPVPHLVTDYEVNDDATQYVFQIEEGITFHDGTNLNGESVAWNLERFADANGRLSFMIDMEMIDTLEATGDHEVTIEYNEPNPRLLYNLCEFPLGMISRDAFEDAGDDYGTDVAVGTGPFRFEEWADAEYIRLTRFEDYEWGPEFIKNQGPANVEAIEFNIIPEQATLNSELQDGYLDGTSYVELTDASRFDDASSVKLHENPYPYPAWHPFNLDREPTDDIRVRQALIHGLNSEDTITAALDGHGENIHALSPPTSVGGIPEDQATEVGYEFDQERARELLDEAGWTNSSQGETREKDGQPLEIEMLAFDLPQWQPQGEVAQAQWGEIGVNVELSAVEGGTFYDRLENQEYHTATAGTGAEYAADFLMRCLHSRNFAEEGGFNLARYSNPEVDELIERGNNHPDAEERHAALRNAGEIAMEDAIWAPVMTVNRTYAHKEYVSGTDTFTEHQWWPTQYWSHHLHVDL
ncbi:ABC transporter substrate-binding protein [Natronosalvus halobius]|uniref:ABC transporter substrate-binding protein n=1 Tax=Natronosalvus halobius TaxID=2953746 RepID=UPI00209DE143|nr:ABC transporter substrate-binding protein [Natronosalvus halobius]USZ73666.1 ABC transporter substrate-binding protein [Natronosalvus halobius]